MGRDKTKILVVGGEAGSRPTLRFKIGGTFA